MRTFLWVLRLKACVTHERDLQRLENLGPRLVGQRNHLAVVIGAVEERRNACGTDTNNAVSVCYIRFIGEFVFEFQTHKVEQKIASKAAGLPPR